MYFIRIVFIFGCTNGVVMSLKKNNQQKNDTTTDMLLGALVHVYHKSEY